MHVTLRQNMDWVGVIDWNVRDFHGYDTPRGSTYNAYLIRDEQPTLIDTVKRPFAGKLLSTIRELIDPGQIRYIVCNHAEPDHASALPIVLEACPNAEVVCDQKCKDTLSRYEDTSDWKFRVVSEGQELSIGERTLRFIETPMAHWPESMFTYAPEDKVLFSMDAFGQHYATSGRFDDETNLARVLQEAKTYYANIIMPYGKQVRSVLEKASGLDIEVIAPSHGVIWRKHLQEILKAYSDWANYKAKAKVLVMYDTMWTSTEQMAQAIIEGAMCSGVEAQLFHVRKTDITTLAMETLDAAAIAFGSPTLNRLMMPYMSALLTYLRGLRPLGKAGFAFGSYGWAKGGAKEIDQALKDMKFEILCEPIQSNYAPTQEDLDTCRAMGCELANKALTIAE